MEKSNVQKVHANPEKDAAAEKGSAGNEGANENEQAGEVLTVESFRAYVADELQLEAEKFGLRVDVVDVEEEAVQKAAQAQLDDEAAKYKASEEGIRAEAEKLNALAEARLLTVKVARMKPAELDPKKWPAMRYDPETKEGKVFAHPDDVPTHYVENPWK